MNVLFKWRARRQMSLHRDNKIVLYSGSLADSKPPLLKKICKMTDRYFRAIFSKWQPWRLAAFNGHNFSNFFNYSLRLPSNNVIKGCGFENHADLKILKMQLNITHQISLLTTNFDGKPWSNTYAKSCQKLFFLSSLQHNYY